MATEITPRELKAALDRGAKLVIVDVREPQEYQIARIAGSVLIPLGEIPQSYGEIDKNQLVVCQCRSGVRSGKAAAFLRGVGFKTIRPHPRWPRLRMELRSAMTWKEDVEAALEQLLGTITIPLQTGAPEVGLPAQTPSRATGALRPRCSGR